MIGRRARDRAAVPAARPCPPSRGPPTTTRPPPRCDRRVRPQARRVPVGSRRRRPRPNPRRPGTSGRPHEIGSAGRGPIPLRGRCGWPRRPRQSLRAARRSMARGERPSPPLARRRFRKDGSRSSRKRWVVSLSVSVHRTAVSLSCRKPLRSSARCTSMSRARPPASGGEARSPSSSVSTASTSSVRIRPWPSAAR